MDDDIKSANISNIKKISIGTIVVLALMIGLSYSATQKKNTTMTKAATLPTQAPLLSTQTTLSEALTTNGRFMPQNTIVTVVKGVPVYNRDLNYILYTDYSHDFASISPVAVDLKKKIVKRLIDEELLLSKANTSSTTTVSVPTKTFDELTPDYYAARQKAIQTLAQKLDTVQEKVSGAVILYWYHNVELPKSTPLATAKTMAETKIRVVQTAITAGESFEQAGAEAKRDVSWKNIDPSYEVNNYFTFTDKNITDPIFGYKELNDTIKTLQPGQVSDIILHSSTNPSSTKGEEFYALIKVTKRTNVGQTNSVDTVKNEETAYPVPNNL